jgi:hypothetical protein
MAILRHSQPDQRERRSVGRAARLTCGPPAVARLRCPKRAICGQPRTREEMACHWTPSFCRGCNDVRHQLPHHFPRFHDRARRLARHDRGRETRDRQSGLPAGVRFLAQDLRAAGRLWADTNPSLAALYARYPARSRRSANGRYPPVAAVRPTTAFRPFEDRLLATSNLRRLSGPDETGRPRPLHCSCLSPRPPNKCPRLRVP